MNTDLLKMNRRLFLLSGLASLPAGAALSANFCDGSPEKPSQAVSRDPNHYENRLRDHLWMWGHENPVHLVRDYKIPAAKALSQADAVAAMGIPNDCVIRWTGLPEPPFDKFIKQFKNTKRVAWSIIDGAPQPIEVKKKMAFDLAEKMPNLTTFFLDDYFFGDAVPKTKNGKTESPANLTVDGIRSLYREVKGLPRPIDLAVVLYSRQLNPAIADHLEHCDVVSFWTWDGKHLADLEKNFANYRKILPEKRTLLGIYMWDFGGRKPVQSDLMKKQCDFALKLYKEGEIEGMIFHCTPLVGRNIEAVEYAKKWIDEHAEE
ncbi:MAG: hypothetical protein Q4G69_13160 [Planctomycetia bacterium]|nr:hypothetical protein [Planctomycetia bacterium]